MAAELQTIEASSEELALIVYALFAAILVLIGVSVASSLDHSNTKKR